MNASKEALAARWDALVNPAKKRGLGSREVRQLAKQAGTQWYVSRGDEKLEDFLEQNGTSLLFKNPGFGRRKLTKLCDILENLGETTPEPGENEIGMVSAQQRLEKYGCPINFPCRLAALPIRIQNYCEMNGVISIGELIEEWERLGYRGLMAERNLGSKSVQALGDLVANLKADNCEAVALVLPLKSGEPGIDFAASLAQVLSEQGGSELKVLEQRLVARLTLAESAEVQGFTRERVRQIEAKFLAGIEGRLDYFHRVRGELLSAWMNMEDWFPLVGWHGNGEGAKLAKASLETIFRGSAQGVARNLVEDTRMDRLELEIEADPDLWFGGVAVDPFLAKLPDEEAHQFLTERLMGGNRFRLDQSNGRIHPARTDLRRCVEAMVADEDDPLPLSWIIELLNRTGYHPGIERIDILRRRSSWRKREDFPDEMIRWFE